MKRPNPVFHMMTWGFSSGMLLFIAYYIFLAGLFGMSPSQALSVWTVPEFVIGVFFLGSLPGLFLGFIEGLHLWGLIEIYTVSRSGLEGAIHKMPLQADSRNMELILQALAIDPPFSSNDMQQIRYKVYGWIGCATIFEAALLITVFLMDETNPLHWIFYLPPFIAGIASAYAAHRYMLRLRHWSDEAYGAQKEKRKNTERLEDRLKNDDSDFEESDEGEKYEEA